jgi:PPP family 3-phenylpropionic acid transporter
MTQRYPTVAVPSKWAGTFYACYFGVLGVVLPFLGPYLEQRGLGEVAIGLATAAFSIAKLGYAPFLGRWVDRGGWRPGVLSLHVLVAVAAAVAMVWFGSPLSLGLALLVIGLGYGTVLPLVEAAILERLPDRGYGFVRWWGSAGFIAFAGLAAVILGDGKLNRFPAVMIGSLVLLGLSCLPLESEARPRVASGDGQWIQGTAWFLLVILTLHQVAHGPYYAFFSIHLSYCGFGTAAIAGLWSLAVASELVAFALGAGLERRIGLRRLLTGALLITPFRWLLLAAPPSMPVLVLGQIGHAVTFAAVHLAGVQLVQRIVPAGARRNAQALYSGLSFGLGIVLGTALAGPLYAAVSGPGSFLVAAGISVLVACAWIGVAHRLAA